MREREKINELRVRWLCNYLNPILKNSYPDGSLSQDDDDAPIYGARRFTERFDEYEN